MEEPHTTLDVPEEPHTKLLEKEKDITILCKIPMAMVVYGPGNTELALWLPGHNEAKDIMHKNLELPEASNEKSRLDNEVFLH